MPLGTNHDHVLAPSPDPLWLRLPCRPLEDQHQKKDHHGQADQKDDSYGAADELEHECSPLMISTEEAG